MRTLGALIVSFCALALTACGSNNAASTTPSTPTVTVTTSSSRSLQSTTQTATTATHTSVTASVHTGAGPAFTRSTGGTPAAGGSGGDLGAALATLRAHDFSALSPATYATNQTLRVLLGARSGSADAHTQQAFFFDGTRYLGTDTTDTSAQISVVGQSDTEVTLRYAIFRQGDRDCCPTGGSATVRFQLDMGRLSPLDPIPGSASRR